jgi:hypothetical protein
VLQRLPPALQPRPSWRHPVAHPGKRTHQLGIKDWPHRPVAPCHPSQRSVRASRYMLSHQGKRHHVPYPCLDSMLSADRLQPASRCLPDPRLPVPQASALLRLPCDQRWAVTVPAKPDAQDYASAFPVLVRHCRAFLINPFYSMPRTCPERERHLHPSPVAVLMLPPQLFNSASPSALLPLVSHCLAEPALSAQVFQIPPNPFQLFLRHHLRTRTNKACSMPPLLMCTS